PGAEGEVCGVAGGTCRRGGGGAGRRGRGVARRLPVGVVVTAGIVGEVGLAGTVGVHDEHLVVAGAVRGEDDLAAIGGEGRRAVQGGALGEGHEPGAVGVDQPDVVPLPEDDALPVRGVARGPVVVRAVGDVVLVRAVGVHHVDLELSVALALEGDVGAVRGPVVAAVFDAGGEGQLARVG